MYDWFEEQIEEGKRGYQYLRGGFEDDQKLRRVRETTIRTGDDVGRLSMHLWIRGEMSWVSSLCPTQPKREAKNQ